MGKLEKVMFTGIIQNLGRVTAVSQRGKVVRMAFQFEIAQKQVQKGESIAVNGVCLTAIRIDSKQFEADLVLETMASTNLGQLKPKDRVNLERSLRVGDAIGGHIVTGHVDAVGKISEIRDRVGNWSLLVHAPKTIISKLAVKGSVACDGVSLTLQAVNSKTFCVAVIPHTLVMTTLRFLKVGHLVNLEVDHSFDLMRHPKRVRNMRRLNIQNLIKQGF